MTVGERIRQKRMELGLSQDELARRMGYKNKSAICRVERDYEQNLTLDRVTLFAQALGCTESYLMGWSEPDTQPIPEYFPEIQTLTNLLPQLTQVQRNTLVQTAKVFVESNNHEP